MKKILVIQTAFIGDVILATGVLETLHQHYPNARIDFLVRKGNEGLVINHPFLHRVLVWNKKGGKYKNLIKLIGQIRKEGYDSVFNLQRFAASGVVTFLSGAKYKAGFDKNPFSFCYHNKVNHEIGNGKHEIERNQEVILPKVANTALLPKLYPSSENYNSVSKYKSLPYVVIAPASVWFTKQLPIAKWVELIKSLRSDLNIYLIGGLNDKQYAQDIIKEVLDARLHNLCGALNFLESAALMKDAEMNYVNDSAPLHMAGAVNAPVTAFFCSTLPSFGFGPFQTQGKTFEVNEPLNCRPCGLHGKQSCPKGHFKCALNIDVQKAAV